MKWLLIITAFHFHDGGVYMATVPMESLAICEKAAEKVQKERIYGYVSLYTVADCVQVSDSESQKP